MLREVSNNNSLIVKRGQIYWVDLPKIEGSSIQAGIHPCLMLQNNVGNKFSPNVQVCSLTSKIFKKDMPTHIKIESDRLNNLDKDSVILVETVTNVPKTLIKGYIGEISDDIMGKVDEALKIQLGLKNVYFNEEYVSNLLNKIKNTMELFFRYNEDEFLKELTDGSINELKKYCESYNRNYEKYLINSGIMINTKVANCNCVSYAI